MEWPKEVVLNLIAERKKRPMLWDAKDQSYKNQTIKADCLYEIENNLE
jgi:hypothetical protein